MPVQVPVEILRFGIFDALLQHDAFRILRGHVDQDVGRNAVPLIGQPLDGTGVNQRRDAHRHVVVVDLGIIVRHLKLGNHVHQASHLPVAQKGRGILIQKRDGTVIRLFDILGKFPGFHAHQLLIPFRIDHRRGQKRADPVNGQDHKQQDSKPFEQRIFGKGQPHGIQSGGRDPLPGLSDHIDQHDGHNSPHQEEPEAAGMNVDRGERDVIVEKRCDERGRSDDRIQYAFFHLFLISRKGSAPEAVHGRPLPDHGNCPA